VIDTIDDLQDILLRPDKRVQQKEFVADENVPAYRRRAGNAGCARPPGAATHPPGMAEQIVDVLETIQIQVQHRDLFTISARPDQRQRKMIAEQIPVRQTGQRIVIGLVIGQRLDFSARRGIARNAIVMILIRGIIAGFVCGQADHRQIDLEVAKTGDVGMAFEAQFKAVHCGFRQFLRAEGIARPLPIMRMHQTRKMTPKHDLVLQTQQRLHSIIDEGNAPILVEDENNVGRSIDQKTMQSLGTVDLMLRQVVFALQRALRQRTVDGVDQELGLDRLAHKIKGAKPQCQNRGIDFAFTADDDDGRRNSPLTGAAYHVVTADIRQAEIHQNQIEMFACQHFQAALTGRRNLGLKAVETQEKAQALGKPGIILDDQESLRSRLRFG
jgi:hypothetical protein